jgi:hypothetical protein
MPGEDTVVTAFEAEHIFFTGEENKRQVDVDVLFPEDGAYESIRLDLSLGCPNDNCDHWDRAGFLGIVNDGGTEEESVTEIARFMTPYGVGVDWQIDVTELRPLLAGSVTLRVFIDTWVGPGHQQGDGWLVDAAFDMTGGVPEPLPLAVVPLWNMRDFEYGNPDAPIEVAVPPVDVALPEETTAVSLRVLVTGHGQGNAENCAEFCPKNHGFQVDDEPVFRMIWRDDCDRTPVEGQQGTWTLSRAGWCPGAEVVPWIEDVTAFVEGEEVTLVYGVEPYENTCRPDAPVCEGCTLGTGCEYDGGNHTMPIYRFSAALVAYR